MVQPPPFCVDSQALLLLSCSSPSLSSTLISEKSFWHCIMTAWLFFPSEDLQSQSQLPASAVLFTFRLVISKTFIEEFLCAQHWSRHSRVPGRREQHTLKLSGGFPVGIDYYVLYMKPLRQSCKKCASLKLKAVGLADLIGMARLWMKRTYKTVFLQSPYCAYFSSHPSNTDLSVFIHS